METIVFLLFGGAFWYFKNQEQQRRIALLGSHLSRFDIESLMETLMTGYLRALDANDARQAQVWSHLGPQEQRLSTQLDALAHDMSDVWADSVRISTFPVALPWADKLFPSSAFDLRRALRIHADGYSAVLNSAAITNPKDKAFMLTAEMLLLQHTCHWFCRSKTVATARLMARHQTRYEQVLAAVSERTRLDYGILVRAQAGN